MNSRVLVVDDDPALTEMLTIVLRNEGFDARVAEDGTQVLPALAEFSPHVVLLDLMLPGMNGIDICRNIRADSDVPIMMLSAKSESADIVEGLEAGADDYVVKPFRPTELIARIRARLRRTETPPAEVLATGDLMINIHAHQVTRHGTAVGLTPLEFDLLVALARRPGQVLSREALLHQVWGCHDTSDIRLVNLHVQRLRTKIEHDRDNPKIVLTVPGIGYQAAPSSAP